MSDIVVISHAGDPHAMRVMDLLARGGRSARLLDLGALPERASLSVAYDRTGVTRAQYREGDCCPSDLLHARSVWWRRPQAPDLSSVQDPDALAFAHNEWQEALHGLWQLMDARWMNPPGADDLAGRKAHQLNVAARLGLRTPRTLITSNPQDAREFIRARRAGETIFKTFSCTHAIWRETRVVTEEAMAEIDSVRWSPVIFQELIRAEADVRVTFVAGRAFAATIDCRDTDYQVDFRMSLGQAKTSATELPGALVERLGAFMDRLGLVYGAIDLRRTDDGDYVFLEVNTAGEFLFVEERTGLPIAQAVADWLARPA